MKKKFIALAIAGSLISALSHAQIKKGSLSFGGSVGFSSTKQESKNSFSTSENKQQQILFSPSFAYAIADNFFLGADLSFTNSKNEYTNTKYKGNSAGGGVFARKYWSIADRLYIFGQGRVGFDMYKYDVQSYPPTSPTSYHKGYNVYASLYPGISLALSKKVQLESTFLNLITVQYNNDKEHAKPTDDKITKSSDFYVNSTFNNSTQFTIGVKVLLSK